MSGSRKKRRSGLLRKKTVRCGRSYSYCRMSSCLCDYKTGKAKDLKDQDFSQLIYYALYFFTTYKYIQKVKLSFIYVEHNTENVLELSRESCETFIQQLKQNIKAIENDSEFVSKKSWKCNYCSFKSQCETKC